MEDTYGDNQSGVAYAAPAQTVEAPRQAPTQPLTSPYQAYPGQMRTPSTKPPVNPRRSNGGLIAMSLVLMLVLGVGLFAGWQFGHTSTSNGGVLQSGTGQQSTVPALTGNNIQAVREAVIAKVRPAVVEVNVTTQQGGAIGSGVVIDGRGYIITNNHVVSGQQSMNVTLYDGTNVPAQLVGTDPTDDLAVVKITPPSKGLTVVTIGIPTLTAIDPEFNTPASGVGFAIPSNRVASVGPQIIASGSVTHTGRAALGVSVTTVDANLAAQDNLSVDHGALIASVLPNGAAAAAGLQAGDVIVQFDHKTVTDTQSLGDAIANHNPGDTVTVNVVRGTQQMTVNVKLGELQAGN